MKFNSISGHISYLLLSFFIVIAVEGIVQSKIPDDHYGPEVRITDVQLLPEKKTRWQKYSDNLDHNDMPIDLVLPHSKHDLRFDYNVFNVTDPDAIGYEYKLVGLDDHWSKITKEKSAVFTNLKPGEYNFKVKARSNDGFWSEQRASFSFKIKKPFWQTSECHLLIIILITVISYFLSRWRLSYLRKAKTKLEETVNERTQELAQKNDKLETAYLEIELKNKDITDSLRYALQIQKAILPTKATIKASLPDSFILYKPKDIVSGDFYWYDEDDTINIAAVDCTGHGVPGAFVSMVGYNALNNIVHDQHISEPGKVLKLLHKKVKMMLNQDSENTVATNDGMDIALCNIDSKNKTIKYAGANRPLYYISNDQLEEIRGTRYCIGGYQTEDERDFVTNEIRYKTGDCIYISSDGYADQFGGENGKKFMTKKLKALLVEISQLPMEQQKKQLEEALISWKGNHDQIDDILLIGIRLQ